MPKMDNDRLIGRKRREGGRDGLWLWVKGGERGGGGGGGGGEGEGGRDGFGYGN